jgi:uncharacterized BrkB/YihY/UPF0761 family membrane protein
MLYGNGSPPVFAFASASASAIVSRSHSVLSVGFVLTSYLGSDPASQFDDAFNILSWWHDHKRTYHVLSILAKDILIVPISIISSESVFSLASRVIEEQR